MDKNETVSKEFMEVVTCDMVTSYGNGEKSTDSG